MEWTAKYVRRNQKSVSLLRTPLPKFLIYHNSFFRHCIQFRHSFVKRKEGRWIRKLESTETLRMKKGRNNKFEEKKGKLRA